MTIIGDALPELTGKIPTFASAEQCVFPEHKSNPMHVNAFSISIVALFLLFCGITSDIQAQEILRGPYIQFTTTNSAIIRWRTDSLTSSKVWYGLSHTNLSESITNTNLTTEHQIEVTGLSAHTDYFYAVGTADTQLAGATSDHYFKTHPQPGSQVPVNIWVLGDAGSKNMYQRKVRDAFYNYNGSDHIDMMLLLGDNAYEDGTEEDYQLGWFEDMYEDRLINSVMWSCFGNHDGNSASSNTQSGPYFDIFNFPTDAELGGAPSQTEAYFSFDYANIHVISLNTFDVDRTPAGPMLQWLEEDLAATNQDWIIALVHHPPYTGYNNNNSDTNTREREMRENAVPILEDAGVDVVLMGHSHLYQRSMLIHGHYDVSATFDPDVMAIDRGDGRLSGDGPYVKSIGGPDNGKGAIYLNAGSAGKLSEYAILNHPIMCRDNSDKHGSVAINVDELQMDIYFVDEDENVDDHFTIVKQNQPPNVDLLTPAFGTYYDNIEQINITADASDPNGSVAKVEFFVNNVLIGTDFSAPYEISWTAPALGAYRIKAVATDNETNFRSDVSDIQIGPITICEQILTTTHDGEEDQFGTVSLGSSDLEIAYDDTHQTIGLRFVELGIPKNSVINSAFIQFTAKDGSNLNPCEINIYAEDTDDSSSFLNEDFDLSTRPKTDATVLWTPNNWDNAGDSGSDQQTVDISSVIQEVVVRQGYSDKSNITILLDGVGRRRALSKNGDPNKAPILCLEYNPFCEDSDNDGTCDVVDQCPGGPEPGTPCNDGDPVTFDDAIDENCACTGQTYDCPQHSAYIGDPCNDNNPDTYNDLIDNNCNCIGIATAMTLTCTEINASDNDAEEKEDGEVSLSSGDLEMVMDNSSQTIGLRFTGLNIPFGAIIQHASVQFTTDETDNVNPCSLYIYGEATANPLPFSVIPFDITNRPRTNASISWTPADWNKIGRAGIAERTIDISEVIQEVVNRWGFSDTSPIVLIVDGIGKRTAESHDAGNNQAPQLCVDYYIDTPPPAQDDEGQNSIFAGSDQEELLPQGLDNRFRIYPNPTSDQLHLDFNCRQEATTDFLLRDLNGRTVFSRSIRMQPGNNHYLIPRIELPNGVYTAQMMIDGRWEWRRLMVVRPN